MVDRGKAWCAFRPANSDVVNMFSLIRANGVISGGFLASRAHNWEARIKTLVLTEFG